MSILQFSPVKVGQVGVKPATYKMVSTDSLATVSTAGFLKQGTGGQFLERNDLVEVIASFGSPSVENAQLYVTIDTNGVITLNVDLPEGLGQAALKNVTNNAEPLVASVSGATVVGHVAVFSDVSGTVEDGGALGTASSKDASANSEPTVASVRGATVANNAAVFFDTNGTVKDSGLPLGTAASKMASDNGRGFVASCATPLVVNHVLVAGDVNGTVTDSGLDITEFQLRFEVKANRTANIGGGGAGPINVPVVGLTTNSIVVASIESSSNPVSVIVCDAVVNAFNITFSADPGASCIISYIAYIAQQ